MEMSEESFESSLESSNFDNDLLDQIDSDSVGSLSEFHDIIDFDFYPEDIPTILNPDEILSDDIIEFNLTGLDEDYTEVDLNKPIEFNLNSLTEATDEELSSNQIQKSNLFTDSDDESESISLSPDELGNITSEVPIDSESDDEDDDGSLIVVDDIENYNLNLDDEEISLDSEDLDQVLHPDDEDEVDSEEISIFDKEESAFINDSENSEPSEYDEYPDGEISLSTDELDNILGGEDSFNEDEEDDEPKSFFDSDDEETDELSDITDSDYSTGDSSSLENSASDEDDLISLSADELGNITQVEEGSTDLFAEDSSDDEIALSGDELNNLLGSGDLETEEDESISLSADELGNITAEGDIEEVSTDLFTEDSSDDEIALSGDELNNLLGSGELETEEDESISLSADELGNITGEEQADEDDLADEFHFEDDSSEEEDISLSGSELNNLLESNSDENESASGFQMNEDDFVIDDSSENFVNADESELQFKNVKKEELKKLMSHMDELLGSLPDSYIKEFASSEYFELYKKIMDELEI